MFFNIINLFMVNFDQFDASLLTKSIFKNLTDPKRLNGSICIYTCMWYYSILFPVGIDMPLHYNGLHHITTVCLELNKACMLSVYYSVCFIMEL